MGTITPGRVGTLLDGQPGTVVDQATGANQRPILAVIVATGGMLLFAAMQALVREVSAELHPFQIAFVRSATGVVFTAILVGRLGVSAFRSRAPGLTMLRGALGGVSVPLWFLGLSLVPLAEATALNFSAAIFASIGAVLFLNERMGVRRWSAVAIGLLGTLVMLRPGIEAVQVGALIIIASSLVAAVNMCLAKVLVRRDPAETVVFWIAVIMTIVSAGPAWFVWADPTGLAWLKLILIGCLGSFGMYAVVFAMRWADASLVVPTGFTRLAWAAALGYFLFAEVPDGWTIVGGLLIVSSTIYIGVREAWIVRGTEPAIPAEDNAARKQVP